MIELVFWSFVVALLPIALSLGSRLLIIIAEPFGPPVDRPTGLDRTVRPAPHYATHSVGHPGGIGHGH